MTTKMLTILFVITMAPYYVHGQSDLFTPTLAPTTEATPTPKNLEAVIGAVIESSNASNTENVTDFSSTSSSSTEGSIWSAGRVTQIVLGVVESALLTLVLLFPSLMDPVVNFINKYMGGSGTRRRRDVRTAMIEHASSLHDLLLDAIDKFEEMDAALSLYM